VAGGGLRRVLEPVGGELLVGDLAVGEQADVGVPADEGVEREGAALAVVVGADVQKTRESTP
jgi:hypothetical protein